MTKNIKWSIDPSHSEIAFTVRHLMISRIKGYFKTFDASIYTAGKDFLTADIDMWIDATSISTGDAKRDGHLISPEFFDVDKHKQITFVSSTIGKPDEDGSHALWGELTMMGITKNVKLTVTFGGMVTDPYGHEKAGFSVSGKINRSDWGLTWNAPMETGGFLVSEEVTISCDIELINLGEKDLIMELDTTSAKKA
ncbi:MAG: YceI family protein [Bacteroidota bacterium]|uniref:YceI family protein n=1 Tax=Runella sp. TaxID=1960881 RepID=UPI003017975E